MISLILGSVFNIIALGIGNQFLMSSTCALSIIFNTLLSVCFLKETIHQSDIVSLIIISTGCTLFMITAKASDETYTPQMIYDLYVRTTSVIFISFAVVFILSGFTYEKSVLSDLREYRDGL